MLIQPGSHIVMTGDSITDCGRARPIGDSNSDTLGGGYVAMLDWLLTAREPNLNLQVLNTGVSGNTVRELAARWQTDVLDLRPDWLSVMIGVNDVWRQFDTDPTLLRPVHEAEYRDTLLRLLSGVKPSLKGLVVMLPFYLESSAADPMRSMRDRYASACAEVAGSVGAVIVDTQAAFERVLPVRGRDRLAPDGVHPTPLGHMILAEEWARAVASA